MYRVQTRSTSRSTGVRSPPAAREGRGGALSGASGAIWRYLAISFYLILFRVDSSCCTPGGLRGCASLRVSHATCRSLGFYTGPNECDIATSAASCVKTSSKLYRLRPGWPWRGRSLAGRTSTRVTPWYPVASPIAAVALATSTRAASSDPTVRSRSSQSDARRSAPGWYTRSTG